MEQLPVSMLCATEPDAAVKHHGRRIRARFVRVAIAAQHAPTPVPRPQKL